MNTQAVRPSMAKQKKLMKKAIGLVGSQARLAEAIGCSQMMVWKLAHGHAGISVEMARKIHQATEGAVQEGDLRPDFFTNGQMETA